MAGRPRQTRPEPALTGSETCDLLVVGGGYSGLWTALLAKERDPRRDVVLVEGREAGWAASGRNGGLCAASLTHGLPNGLSRWPDEMDTLQRLGAANIDAIEEAVARYDLGLTRGSPRHDHGTWPDLRSLMTWSINGDRHGGREFRRNFDAYFG